MRSPLPKTVSKKVITSDKNEVSEKKIVTPCPELLKVQEIMKKHNIKPSVKVSQKALEAINSGLEEAKKGVYRQRPSIRRNRPINRSISN